MSWPTFLSMHYAWLALLFVPLVIFYFLKLRRPQVKVPSLLLWQQVINDQRVNSPFQRFKRNLLLLLQALLLAALILAAMQPFWAPQSDRVRYLPVLIDTSASMAAKDGATGKTRLDLVKVEVGRLIDNLMTDQQMTLIGVNASSQRLTSFTNNKRVLREALQQIQVQDLPSRLEESLRMTQAMARSARIERVLFFTDGNVPERIDFELPFDVSYQQVGKVEANVGITAFTARRSGAHSWQVFLRIDGSETTAAGTKVQLLQDKTVIAEDFANVKPGESSRVLFSVDATTAVSLEAVLIPDGPDALDRDNKAFLQLPVPRPLRVYCPVNLESFRHALLRIPDLELFPAESSSAEPAASYDLYIAEGPFPAEGIEAHVRILVDTVPLPLQSVVTRREGIAEVIDWKRNSPLLQYVQLSDVVCSDSILQREGIQETEYEQVGFEVLIYGQQGPLAVREVGQPYEAFHLLFHPDRSTLVYRVGFPVLVSNAVRIAQQSAALTELFAGRTGVLEVPSLQPSQDYVVKGPNGQQVTAATAPDGHLVGVGAPWVGSYQIFKDGSEVAQACASLLDTQETSLVSRKELQFREGAVTVADTPVKKERPLWHWLAWLAFALLMLEWWYAHYRPDIAGDGKRPSSARTASARRFRVVSLLAVIFLFFPGVSSTTATAQEAGVATKERHGLRSEFATTNTKHRTDAPILPAWKIEWEKEQLLEGHFRLEFFQDLEKYQVYESDDYVLTKGDRTIRMLIPASLRSGYLRNWMKMTFVGEEREYDLGEFDIALQSFHHACAACQIASRSTVAEYMPEIEISRQLRFESFLENRGTFRAARWLPNTLVTPWEPADMPTNPLYYTPFDQVFLGSDSFATISPAQLTALREWVRAGGRLCLCVHGELDSHQEQYVRELIRAAGSEEGLPDDGKDFASVPPGGVWLVRHGLGRVALVPIDATAKSMAVDIQAIHHFLWRYPSPLRPATASPEAEPLNRPATRRLPSPAAALVPRRNNSFEQQALQLNMALVPPEVRSIPIAMTGLLLGIYVMLIGPVDYFVLRGLRRQRWTWLTFPVMTLLSAIAYVQISNFYLSTRDDGGSLLIRDVDEQGELLAENRFHLTFSGSRRLTTDEVHGALMTVIPLEVEVGQGGFRTSYAFREPVSQYTGSIPVQFKFQRMVDKWKPRLDRYLSIGSRRDGIEDNAPVRYPEVGKAIAAVRAKVAGNSTDVSGHQLAPTELAAIHENANAMLLKGGTQHIRDFLSDVTVRVPYDAGDELGDVRYQMGFGTGANQAMTGSRLQLRQGRSYSPFEFMSLVAHMSVYHAWDRVLPELDERDLFAFWDLPVSPHGGADFQDLAIMDFENSNESLILIAHPAEKGTTIVYRYHFERARR